MALYKYFQQHLCFADDAAQIVSPLASRTLRQRCTANVHSNIFFQIDFGIISGRQIPDYECSFVYNSSFESTGWFHSPNFPGAYPRYLMPYSMIDLMEKKTFFLFKIRNIECNYYFHGRTMERVHIRFTYFDVEGVFP